RLRRADPAVLDQRAREVRVERLAVRRVTAQLLTCAVVPHAEALQRALVAAERQAVRLQRFLDLLDRLLAEVRNRRAFGLGLPDEVADRLDSDALEAVVRPHAQLELLDR